jgi:hypothetical protein
MANGWRTVTINALLSWLMKLLLVGLFPYLIAVGNYLLAAGTFLAIVVSMVPSMVERNYRIHLPFELDLLITSIIFFHLFLGEWLMFYEKVRVWDKILHFYGAVVVSILAFVTVYSFRFAKKLRITLPFIGVFTLVFAIAMGALWELFEFWVDTLFGTTMQNGLEDTMWDLMYDVVGGVVTAVLGMLYVRSVSPEARRRLATPIGEILGMRKNYNEKIREQA